MLSAGFEVRDASGQIQLSLNSPGGVYGGAVTAKYNESIEMDFPMGKGLEMWCTYPRLGAHVFTSGLRPDGTPFVGLTAFTSLSRIQKQSIVQVFFL